MGFHPNVDSEVPRESARLPPVVGGSEAVEKVFDINRVRPLEPASFQPLRRYFSVRQQKRIDQFLAALNQLTVKRNCLADRMGIRQDWWWPADLNLDVRALMKSDPLTDRALVPDEVRISDPTVFDRKLEIMVEDRYNEIARDGTDLGGTKSSRVTLIPENGRWVIDSIVFTVRQYERMTVTSLAQILDRNIKQLRLALRKIPRGELEVRTPKPASGD